MCKYFVSCIVLFSVLSCTSHQEKNNSAMGNDGTENTAAARGIADDYLTVDKDSVLIPSFAVEINLSGKATEKLLKEKESMLVTAWFSGMPKDTTSKEFREWGEMFIRSFSIELDTGRIARFEGVKFSKSIYELLEGKDIKVLVNVYSGRKSSPDNLLDCEILSERISTVKERTMLLSGKLISEADSLQ